MWEAEGSMKTLEAYGAQGGLAGLIGATYEDSRWVVAMERVVDGW